MISSWWRLKSLTALVLDQPTELAGLISWQHENMIGQKKDSVRAQPVLYGDFFLRRLTGSTTRRALKSPREASTHYLILYKAELSANGTEYSADEYFRWELHKYQMITMSFDFVVRVQSVYASLIIRC